MAASSKKFKNSNLNALLGAPKESPVNFGPAVRSAALIKPVAKPKGLVSLGKAPVSSNVHARKGAAFAKLEEKAKEEEEAKGKDADKGPDWAVIDVNDLDKPLGKGDEGYQEEDDREDSLEVQSGQAERQYSNSHRSYLSMEYAPGTAPAASIDRSLPSTSGGYGGPPSAVAPPPPPPMEDPMRFGGPPPRRSSAGPPPSAPPPRPGDEARPRTSSWADQTELEEEAAAAAAAAALLPPRLGAGPPPPGKAPGPPLAGSSSAFGREPPFEKPPPYGVDQNYEGVGPADRGGRGAPPHGAPPPPSSAGGGPPPAGPPPRRPLPGPPGEPVPQPSAHTQQLPVGTRTPGPPRPVGPPPPVPPPSVPKQHYQPLLEPPPSQRRQPAPAGAPGAPARGSPKQAPVGSRGGVADSPQHAGANGFERHWRNDDAEGEAPGSWLGGGTPTGDSRPSPAEQGRNCWGPAVAYTPAFAPRGPPANRPMSEDFVNSGWKEKKLWAPPAPPKHPSPVVEEARGPRGPGSPQKGIASALGASPEQAGAVAEDGSSLDFGGGSEPSRPPKQKKSKMPKSPLEALDPDSSSSESDSDGSEIPAEYAVLDMTVPRTALVINVSHVLKRLNGCCSLNQLTKAIKHFKEKSGVTLEAFLRANPYSFQLEGRIVYLLDKGEKWTPPASAQTQGLSGKGDGSKGGKGSSGGGGKGGALQASAKHSANATGAAQAYGNQQKASGEGAAAKGGKGAEKGGGGKAGASKDASAAAPSGRRKRGGGGGGYNAGYEEEHGWEDADWAYAAWERADWKASSAAWHASSAGWDKSNRHW